MRHKKPTRLVCLFIGFAFFFEGCASLPGQPPPSVKKTVVSGSWDPADARVIAYELVSDCLGSSWLLEFNAEHQREPVVTVGPVLNQTSEKIDMTLFMENLSRDLLRPREIIVKDFADPAAGDAPGEAGPDFILRGSLHAFQEPSGGQPVNVYRVNLELVEAAGGNIVWLGETELRKQTRKTEYRHLSL